MIRMKLSWLTFNMLEDTFPTDYKQSLINKKWSYGISMPNGQDSMRSIQDSEGLERYKKQIYNQYGDIIIVLNQDPSILWYEKAVIDCPDFREKQRIFGENIKKALNN